MQFFISIIIFFIWTSAFAVDDYSRLSAKLNTIETRVRDQRKSIIELAVRKNKETSKEQKLKLIEQMKVVNQTLNKDIDEYNDIKSKIEHRFPKQKSDLERQYRPQKRQSIDEIESNVGLIKNIEKVEDLLEKQYGKFKKTTEVEKLEKQIKVKKNKPKKEEPKKLRLVN